MRKKTTNDKKKKKIDYVVLSVLGCFIIYLLFFLIILNKYYFNVNTFSIDYLNFKAKDFDAKNINVVDDKEGNCHILLLSKTTKENVLGSFKNIKKINNYDWVYQEFDKGITWMSYYKDVFYIVQMYADSEEKYKDMCESNFAEIKDTFSFDVNE